MSVFYPSEPPTGKPNLADLRLNYEKGALDEPTLPQDPFVLFKMWLDDAIAAAVMEPNAMTLATVSADGQPSCRTVLLKGFEPKKPLAAEKGEGCADSMTRCFERSMCAPFCLA